MWLNLSSTVLICVVLGNESIDVIIFSSNTNFSIVGKPVQGGKSRSGRFRLNKKLFL